MTDAKNASYVEKTKTMFWDTTRSITEKSQGLLATDLSKGLNDVFQSIASQSATVYDKAMDAGYLATHIGGSNHRLFDGGHTLAGAFQACKDALPDDTAIQEAYGMVQGLFKDVTTAKGLPLANWDKATYDQVAESLSSTFHIPKSWFADLNTYDAAELLGSAIGAVSVALNWNTAKTEDFARLVGSMGLSAAASMNPLLLVITIVSLAKAFHTAHKTGEYAELADGQLKGAAVSGASIGAVALVGAAGAPIGIGLLLGVVMAILANKATKNVSVVDISKFVSEQATALTAKTASSTPSSA